MSYVIQHFYQPISVSRITYRKYYNWLYRNIPFMVILIEYTALADKIYLRNLNPVSTRPIIINLAFRGAIKKLFTKLILRWRPIRESQHVRGVEYWAYKSALAGFGDEHQSLTYRPYLTYSNTYFYNQPFIEQKYVIISFSQKYYRQVMVHFLHLILRGWQFWRSETKYSLNLIAFTTEFSLLSFFNSRFFRAMLV